MTKTIERPQTELKIPPGLFVPEIENDLTRREFLIGAGLIVLAPGCGAGEEAANGGEETSGQTRTIEHKKYGTTEVPTNPQRVVALGYTDKDPVLALGVTPVGVRRWYPDTDYPYAFWPWAQDELGDATPTVLPREPINFEQIATLNPDLITAVYEGITEDEYETLSQIAPTVAHSDEYPDYQTPWQEMTQTIGRAVGREERSRKLVDDIEARFAKARQQHPEFGGATAVVADFYDGTYGVYAPQDPRGRFLTSLGFEIPDKIAELVGDEFYTEISSAASS